MDFTFLNLFSTFQNRSEFLDLLVGEIRKQPQCFENFVRYCERKLPKWSLEIAKTNTFGKVQHVSPKDHDLTQTEIAELQEQVSKIPILITATQYPSYGGSATNAYKLTKFFRDRGLKVACLFFENLDFAPAGVYDPDKINGVFRAPRFTSMNKTVTQQVRSQMKRDIRALKAEIKKYLGEDPSVILCKNYVSPVESNFLYPDTPIVYLVSGSWHATELKTTAQEVLTKDPGQLSQMNLKEAQANRLSTMIVPNSSISYNVFSHVYKGFGHKITFPVNTSDLEKINLRGDFPHDGWEAREFDLAFIVSNLSRTVKGPHIALEILRHEQMRSLKKLVIGERKPGQFTDIHNCHFAGKLPHQDCMNFLSRSKIVILTSTFDASPNLLPEAIVHGTYPVCSVNIGNAEMLVDPLYIPDLYDTEVWVSKIKNIITNPPKRCCRPEFRGVDFYTVFLTLVKEVLAVNSVN